MLESDRLYGDFNEVLWKFPEANTATCRPRSALTALPA